MNKIAFLEVQLKHDFFNILYRGYEEKNKEDEEAEDSPISDDEEIYGMKK